MGPQDDAMVGRHAEDYYPEREHVPLSQMLREQSRGILHHRASPRKMRISIKGSIFFQKKKKKKFGFIHVPVYNRNTKKRTLFKILILLTFGYGRTTLLNFNLSRDWRHELEMFAFMSMSYTSLKDLLPASSARAAPPSRKEIAMRDPLLQHAAWAYLQPGARGEDARRWWRKLAGSCGGVFGCLNGVVLVVCKGLFGEPADNIR
ncbi:Unknown protein [Striga hermonthica]|uniref:Uncharacterized protein n=1 Tax=Striga hermonthica TaxID=68872 RepID=A0A9N7R2D1_STRHE|nr:Unknown protein [Striga hermonthica]